MIRISASNLFEEIRIADSALLMGYRGQYLQPINIFVFFFFSYIFIGFLILKDKKKSSAEEKEIGVPTAMPFDP